MASRKMLVLAAALLADAAVGVKVVADSQKSDCWQKRKAYKTALTQLGQHIKTQIPGAGLGKIVPFETVLKDGYAKVQCVKDYMFTYGDKFYDNKHEYNLGEVSNVSIVHYSAVVPKEDKEPMTPEICFNFCRTVPDMLYFGILNGRECYCEPYYKPMESDSTECDATCEGEPTQMCGGKGKSTIWSMHMCANTAQDLSAIETQSKDAVTLLKGLEKNVSGMAADGQKVGENLQKVFGSAGDPVVGDQMQEVKVQAGKLEHLGEDAADLVVAMEKSQADITAKASADFTKFDEVDAAEKLISTVEEELVSAKELIAELEEAQAAKVEAVSKDNAAEILKEYYPVMYFVDKAHEDEPTTCGGETAQVPLMGLSEEECAVACNAHVHSCVAFNYFNDAAGVCLLFSKLKSATHYTDCAAASAAFLQAQKKKAITAKCMAKLSKFSGLNLTPQGDGKCDLCLKKLTKADRCYE